ncbi:MAG: hypothetical protein ACI8ZN_000026 [Bacteroidia bacterium]|jgi:hypothetical protein
MNKIKKVIALVVIASTSISMANAQWYLGLRAGLNMASLNANTGAESSSIMGIHGGLTTKYQFKKKLSIGADALYSTMGSNLTTTINAGGATVSTKQTIGITYVHVPLYLNFEIPLVPEQLVPYRTKESFSSIHLYGGGFFGYALGASSESVITTTNSDQSTTVTAVPKADFTSDLYNPIDFGIIAGAGVSFRLDEAKRQRVGLDFRYLMGFSDFDNTEAATMTNSAIQISLSYQFKLTERIYTNRHKN